VSSAVHPWLGPVAECVKVGRLKHVLAGLKSGGTPDTGNPDFWAADATPWVAISDMSGTERVEGTAKTVTLSGIVDKRLEVLQPGTLLYSMYASLGHVSELAIAATTNQAILGLSFNMRVTRRYAFWQLKALQPYVVESASSNTQDNLNAEKVRNLPFAVPPVADQEKIANFLDDKTSRIDALIAEKERLLEASSCLFMARLGTAVVEGMPGPANLVSAARYGYEAVKEGWSLVPLKHLASSVGGLTPSKDNATFWDGSIPWVSPKDMKSFVIEDSIDHVSEAALEQTSLRLQPVHSVLVVVRGMILAHTFPVALNAVPVTINQDMKALRVKGRVSAHYLAWMLRGLQPLVLSLTDESAHGTKALRTEQWANQCVPVPPVEEQERLVAQFEAWESEAQTLCEHLTVHIARLREYRSSLISAAVTGQIDLGADPVCVS
jgi:type I restriction enzyme S subunit